MMGMKKNKLARYCIVVGHSKKAQGAYNQENEVSEYGFNIELSNKIKEIVETKLFHNEALNRNFYLKELLDIQIVYRGTYKGLPDKIDKLSPKASISLHCNAFNSKASGTEVLCKEDSKKDYELAFILYTNLLGALDLRDRGVKKIEEEDRGGYLVHNTDKPCVISEPFFIDNDLDFERALERFEELAEAIILTFLNNEGFSGVIL